MYNAPHPSPQFKITEVIVIHFIFVFIYLSRPMPHDSGITQEFAEPRTRFTLHKLCRGVRWLLYYCSTERSACFAAIVSADGASCILYVQLIKSTASRIRSARVSVSVGPFVIFYVLCVCPETFYHCPIFVPRCVEQCGFLWNIWDTSRAKNRLVVRFLQPWSRVQILSLRPTNP